MDQFTKRRLVIRGLFAGTAGEQWHAIRSCVCSADGCTLLVEPLPLERRYPSKGANAKTVELVLAARPA